jgi:peptidyl-prolyl cis-trans isomerase SurA
VGTRAAWARPLLSALTLALVAGAALPGADAAEGSTRRVIDRIAALVGDEVITLHELDEAVAPYLARIYRIEDPRKRMEALDRRRSEVLDQLVNDQLILEEARRLDLPVTEEEVDQHIARTLRQAGWSEAELVENLQQLGYPSLEAYRAKTRQELLKAYAFQIRVGSRVNVTEEEVTAAFRERHPGRRQEELHATHILFKVPDVITVGRLADLRDEAEAIRQRILAGEISFADAARKYSQDGGTADDGGDLDWFTRYVLDEAFTAYAFALEPGEISEVVQTPLGLHIIQVLGEREAEIDDFAEEEIRAFIRQELTTRAREKAYRQWMRELRETAYIDLRLKPIVTEPAKAATP